MGDGSGKNVSIATHVQVIEPNWNMCPTLIRWDQEGIFSEIDDFFHFVLNFLHVFGTTDTHSS